MASTLAVTVAVVVLLLLIPGIRGSWKDVGIAGFAVAQAFALTLPLMFVPTFALLSRRAAALQRGSSAAVGALLSLVPLLLACYMFEGFEFGVRGLVADPLTWLWLLAFAGCGAVFGMVWQVQRGSRAL